MTQSRFNLTQESLKALVYYEDGHLKWLADMGGNAKKGSYPKAPNSAGYVQIHIAGKTYKVHRLVFLYHHGYLPEYVDHINRDPSDNRIENLREVTHQQNQWNVGKKSNNTSGFKGVSFHKQSGKWRARSCDKGGRVSLGLFSCPREASEAVIAFEREHHIF